MINYEQIAVAKLVCLILVLELSRTIVWMAVNTAAANPSWAKTLTWSLCDGVKVLEEILTFVETG